MDFQEFVGKQEQSRRPWLFLPKVEKTKTKGRGYHAPHRGRPGKVGGSLPRTGRVTPAGVIDGYDFDREEWTGFVDRWRQQADILASRKLTKDQLATLAAQTDFMDEIAVKAWRGERETPSGEPQFIKAVMQKGEEDYVPEAVGFGYVDFTDMPKETASGAMVVDRLASAPKNNRWAKFPGEQVKGAGTRVMIEFAAEAAKRDLPLLLFPTEAAASYYRRLGFEPAGNMLYLSVEKTKELANAEITY